MKLQCQWNEKMKFSAEADQHRVEMDAKAPIGSDSAMTPKQFLLAGICGCTGMDVVALLRKHKQTPQSFQVVADASMTEGKYPSIFKEVQLTFKLVGDLLPEKVLESVRLSQTKYCGVTAMVSKAVPISYRVELNGKEIGRGEAQFDL